MFKLAGVLLLGLALSACATKPTTAQDVQWTCFVLDGAITSYTALAPALTNKIDATGRAVFDSAKVLVNNTCHGGPNGTPIDVTNPGALIAQLMDAAGKIAAIVAQAKAVT